MTELATRKGGSEWELINKFFSKETATPTR
jgi:hypothetical protein